MVKEGDHRSSPTPRGYRTPLPVMLLFMTTVAFFVHGFYMLPWTTLQFGCPSNPHAVLLSELLDGIISGQVVLVDVRTPTELQDPGKIPGSYNIPLSEVEDAFALPPDQFKAQYGFGKPSAEQLAFSCRSGVRAEEAWRRTLDFGYCQSRVYVGSFLEWSANDLPVESSIGRPLEAIINV